MCDYVFLQAKLDGTIAAGSGTGRVIIVTPTAVLLTAATVRLVQSWTGNIVEG